MSEQSDAPTQCVTWPPRPVFYPAPHGLRHARLRALMAVERNPGWDTGARESVLWQLARRGLVDRDGYGWRLTLAGEWIVASEKANAS